MAYTITLDSGDAFECDLHGSVQNDGPTVGFDLECTRVGHTSVILSVMDTTVGASVSPSPADSAGEELARKVHTALYSRGLRIGDSVYQACPKCKSLASTHRPGEMMCTKGHEF